MLNQLEKMRIAPVYASATTASHFSVPSAAPCQRVGCFLWAKNDIRRTGGTSCLD